jgi:hypothetical protein
MSRQGNPSSGHATSENRKTDSAARHSGTDPPGKYHLRRQFAAPDLVRHLSRRPLVPLPHHDARKPALMRSTLGRKRAAGIRKTSGKRNHETITLFVTIADQSVIAMPPRRPPRIRVYNTAGQAVTI